MATNGPTPEPCRNDIYENGQTVCIVYGQSNAIERWVKGIASDASALVDWHYFGGRGNVLHLGDAESRGRVLEAIRRNPPQEPVDMLQTYSE